MSMESRSTTKPHMYIQVGKNHRGLTANLERMLETDTTRTDKNDSAANATQEATIAEDVANDAVVATVAGLGTNETELFTITAGNDDDIFAINAKSGVITIADNSAIDIESSPLTLTVRCIEHSVLRRFRDTEIEITIEAA